MVGRIALRPGSELKMVRVMLLLGVAVPQGRVVGMVRVTFRSTACSLWCAPFCCPVSISAAYSAACSTAMKASARAG